MRTPLPPTAVVISFIDRINRGDVDGLVALMTDEYALQVLDEAPVVGRDANARAWHGYATAYPHYVIYPERIAADGQRVAVLGRTTGSHLALPDEEELKLSVVWLGEARAGLLERWQILEDHPEVRDKLGLT